METHPPHAASPCGTTAQEQPSPSAVERFWAKVDRRGPDECWEWRGHVGSNGYGRTPFKGTPKQSHRIAFEIANGREPYPFGLHSCDNPICCNPAHIWEGDHADNMRDKAKKGRWANQYCPDGAATPKTHCIHGHEFTPENTCHSVGKRYCLECGRIRYAAKRQKARVSA